MEQFLTVGQAAEILSVTRRRAYQLIREGTLPVAGRVGRSFFLERSTVERLAEQGWPGRRKPRG